MFVCKHAGTALTFLLNFKFSTIYNLVSLRKFIKFLLLTIEEKKLLRNWAILISFAWYSWDKGCESVIQRRRRIFSALSNMGYNLQVGSDIEKHFYRGESLSWSWSVGHSVARSCKVSNPRRYWKLCVLGFLGMTMGGDRVGLKTKKSQFHYLQVRISLLNIKRTFT